MGVVKMIACGLILLPLAEIAAFFVVAGLIGLAWAVMLLVLVSLVGVMVLRRAGNAKSGSGSLAGINWVATAGGVLLLIPGFVSGLLGGLVLHAKSRQWLLRAFSSRSRPRQRRPAEPQVIELSPDEWRRLPEPRRPPRQQRANP